MQGPVIFVFQRDSRVGRRGGTVGKDGGAEVSEVRWEEGELNEDY